MGGTWDGSVQGKRTRSEKRWGKGLAGMAPRRRGQWWVLLVSLGLRWCCLGFCRPLTSRLRLGCGALMVSVDSLREETSP